MINGLTDKIPNQESLELKVCTMGLTEKDKKIIHLSWECTKFGILDDKVFEMLISLLYSVSLILLRLFLNLFSSGEKYL